MGLPPETPPPDGADPLTSEDAAFLALLSGLHRRIEAHRIAFPSGVHGAALLAMQRALAELGAAVTRR